MTIKSLANKDAMDKTLEEHKLVVVDCYADWCGPCKRIAPLIEDMAKKYKHIAFYKVNVDENEAIVKEYKISAMPTFLFIKEGKVVKTIQGAVADKIIKAIEEL